MGRALVILTVALLAGSGLAVWLLLVRDDVPDRRTLAPPAPPPEPAAARSGPGPAEPVRPLPFTPPEDRPGAAGGPLDPYAGPARGLRLRIVGDSGALRALDLPLLLLVTGEETLEGTVHARRGSVRLRLPAGAARALAAPALVAPALVAAADGWLDPVATIERGTHLAGGADTACGPGEEDVAVDVAWGGPPVAGVRLTFSDGTPASGVEAVEPGRRPRRVRTDREGRAWLEASGRRDVLLRPAPGTRPAFADTRLRVPPLEEDRELGVLRLRAPVSVVSGCVQEADGTPVPGARVRVVELAVARATTDGQGRFTVTGPRLPGGRITVSAHTDDGRSSDGVEAAPGARDVTIALPATGSVEGSVVTGDLLPFVSVRVFHVLRGELEQPLAKPFEAPASGRFRVDSVPEGTVDVEVAIEGGGVRRVEGVSVVAGRTTRDPRLQRLALDDGTVPFEVRAVTPGGAPVPGAFVTVAMVARGRTLEVEAETDADGRARPPLHGDAPFAVRVEGPDGGRAVGVLPRAPWTAVLERPAPVRFRVPEHVLAASRRGSSAVKIVLERVPPDGLPPGLDWRRTREVVPVARPRLLLRPGAYRVSLRRGRTRPPLPLGTIHVPPQGLTADLTVQ